MLFPGRDHFVKKLILWAVTLAALASTALRAQDFTGRWQGTLQAGRSLRVVLQVSKENGALKGKFYSIDQGPQGFATSSMAIQGPSFNFAIAPLDISYEGKLSSDNKSVTGTWKGGGADTPLRLEHVTPEAAWPLPVATAATRPMPADADPGYEVATIKPGKPDRQGKGFTLQGRHFLTINTSVLDLITFAYELHPKQVTGGPAWLATEKFDLDVLPDVEGQPSIKQGEMILRKLLADRFQLKFHKDKKELSVYALSPAKAGPKLTKSGSDPGTPPGLGFRGLGKLNVRNATLAEFAQLMQSSVLDRPVVDQTALTDRYDFTLNWTPDESQFGGAGIKVPPPSDAADAPPALYTAIQEQIGLKLEPAKAPVDVLVIDKLEKPSEN